MKATEESDDSTDSSSESEPEFVAKKAKRRKKQSHFQKSKGGKGKKSKKGLYVIWFIVIFNMSVGIGGAEKVYTAEEDAETYEEVANSFFVKVIQYAALALQLRKQFYFVP